MSEETIFSKIISGEIPATKVYEDDVVLAFLDINPSNHGHTLVIPKIFNIDATETDPITLLHIMTIGQRIAIAQRTALGATGNNLIFNCGADGGQAVFHTHLHVIPRHKDDQLFTPPKHTQYTDNEAQIVADKLRASL
jgi:histidine triad (HIT) family protein